MLIIGHRGSPLKFLENTLPSFNHAIANALDGIEVDLRLALDKSIVVFHDDTLDRLSKTTKGRIGARNLNQLKQVELLINGKIISLEEVLDFISKTSPNALIHLDVKEGAVIPILAEKLKLYTNFNILVSSFSIQDLVLFNKLNKKVPLCLSIDEKESNIGVLERLKQYKTIVSWVSVEKSKLSDEFVNLIKARNIKIAAWTIKNSYEFLNAYQYDIDSIITDDVEVKFSSYFAMFCLPQTFSIDELQLEENYIKMQKFFHPDKNIKNSGSIKDFLKKSSMLNIAFNTLRDPLKRTAYLLSLYNISLNLETAIAKPETLMNQMEKMENLSRISSKQQISSIYRLSSMDLRMIVLDMEFALKQKDFEKAKELAIEIKYAQKFLEELKKQLSIFS